jgi:hypothetical protein
MGGNMQKQLERKKVSNLNKRFKTTMNPALNEKLAFFFSNLFRNAESALLECDRKQVFLALAELRKGIVVSFGTRTPTTFPIRKHNDKIVVDVNGRIFFLYPPTNSTNKKINRGVLKLFLNKLKYCVNQCIFVENSSFALKRQDEALKLIDTIQSLALMVL